MSRSRMPHWLGGTKRHSRVDGETRKQRLSAWKYRPALTQLEDRLMPGFVVVALAELLNANQGDPYAQIPEVVAPSAASERTAPDSLVDQTPWLTYVST